MSYIDFTFGSTDWEYDYSNISITLTPLLDCTPDKITFTISYLGDDALCSMSCIVVAGGQTLASVSDTHKGNTKTEVYTLYMGQGLTAFTNITITWKFTNAGIQTGDAEYNGILYKSSGKAPRIQYTVYIDDEYLWKIDANNDGYPWCGVIADPTPFQGYNNPKPLDSWKIDANNDGYPWTWGFTEIVAGQNIFLKTTDGLVPLVAYYNDGEDRLIPLTFIKLT